VADGGTLTKATYPRSLGVKAIAPPVCERDCVTKAILLQCRFLSRLLVARSVSMSVPGLAPDKGDVFLVFIVNDKSPNVHAKFFGDIHFGAKSLECRGVNMMSPKVVR
jgi:hypothetical protein